LDVFKVRDRLIEDYEAFTRGFLEVRDERIRAYVDEQLRRGLRWPDPWLALNPSFQPGGTIDGAVASAASGPEQADCRHENSPPAPRFHPTVCLRRLLLPT
jgi:hypothetical protein